MRKRRLSCLEERKEESENEREKIKENDILEHDTTWLFSKEEKAYIPPSTLKVCSFMLCDLDFEPLSLSLSSLPSCDLMSLTNMLILLHYLESFKSEFTEVEAIVLDVLSSSTVLEPQLADYATYSASVRQLQCKRLKMLLVQSQNPLDTESHVNGTL
ncbi:hypothetical protein Tco_1164875 [Tanacetum coccineum]